MKHLKTFNIFESIIVPTLIDSDMEINSYDDLIKYGEENEFDVVEYDEFYESLPEGDKGTAPPKRNGPPFFALFHPVRKKPMFVVSDRRFFEPFEMPPPPPGMGGFPMRGMGRMRNMPPPRPPYKEIVNDIMGHEMIHKEQSGRRKIEYALPSPTNKNKYFSNKDEIMAFSWTIANEISRGSNSIKDSLKKLKFNKIWIDIERYCDEKIENRYKKYIYLYLEDIFK